MDEQPFPILNTEEQAAMDDLLAAMDKILSWDLKSNGVELASAVHVLQGFIIQHMLQRISPETWGHWYA